MKLVATVQKVTTEALGATELGTWVSILAVLHANMWIPFMAVSLDGAASPVLLFLFVRFCVH